MEIKIETEVMNDVFTKHHLIGLKRSAVIHEFTGADKSIHNHPFNFTSFLIEGYYV